MTDKFIETNTDVLTYKVKKKQKNKGTDSLQETTHDTNRKVHRKQHTYTKQSRRKTTYIY